MPFFIRIFKFGPHFATVIGFKQITQNQKPISLWLIEYVYIFVVVFKLFPRLNSSFLVREKKMKKMKKKKIRLFIKHVIITYDNYYSKLCKLEWEIHCLQVKLQCNHIYKWVTYVPHIAHDAIFRNCSINTRDKPIWIIVKQTTRGDPLRKGEQQ